MTLVAMTNEPGPEPEASVGLSDRDAAYRHFIAETILEFATRRRTLDNPEAYRQVMAVTNRTLGTVKNWLAYRTNLPDLASMARIVEHWNIPPESIFPLHLRALLSGATNDPRPEASRGAEVAASDQLMISLYGPSDASDLDRALSKYSEHPKSAILVRQAGSEMLDEIRPGELVLVDPTCELIRSSGMYLLQSTVEAGEGTQCIRRVDLLMGEPSVRLSCGSVMGATGVETIALDKGNLPQHIAVLGRVVAVLRQT